MLLQGVNRNVSQLTTCDFITESQRQILKAGVNGPLMLIAQSETLEQWDTNAFTMKFNGTMETFLKYRFFTEMLLLWLLF